MGRSLIHVNYLFSLPHPFKQYFEEDHPLVNGLEWTSDSAAEFIGRLSPDYVVLGVQIVESGARYRDVELFTQPLNPLFHGQMPPFSQSLQRGEIADCVWHQLLMPSLLHFPLKQPILLEPHKEHSHSAFFDSDYSGYFARCHSSQR